MGASWSDSNSPRRQEEPGWKGVFALSAVVHLSVFSLVFFSPGAFSTRAIKGDIYEVNLVEMPAQKPGRAVEAKVNTPPPRAEADKVVPEKTAPAKRIATPKAPETEKPVVIAKRTIKQEKPAEKKPEEAPSKLISQALEKVEKKVKSQEKDPLAEALDQMEKKVVTAEKQEHLNQALARLSAEAEGTGGGAFGSPDGAISNRLYEMEIRERIKSNWSYPALLNSEGEKGLEAVFILRVKSDGKILDSRFKRRSSNVLFDQSVMKAIERSDPLPAFPAGYRETFDEIEITFNLRDLKG